MRISIDVDLEPSEIPLANELLQTLRLLTEHVKVKQRTSGAGQAPAAQPAAAPVTPAPVQAPVPAPAPVAAPVAAPVPAAAALPSTPEEARQVFTQLISRLSGANGPSQLDAVAAEAARLLGAAGPVPSTALTEQFNEALCAVAFDRNNIANNQSVEMYLSVLPRLPEAIRNAVKSRTISWVLGFLNQKRPGDNDQQGVMLQADAFAVLVQMDFVAADGTVQTMGKLLKAPDKRMAAVVTLRRLVTRCQDKMRAANPGFLDTTLGLLFTHAYGMPEHRADVEYVFQRLDRPLPQVPAAQPAAAPQVPAAAPVAAPQQQQQQQQPHPQAPAAPPVAAPAGSRGPPPDSLTAVHRGTLTSPVNTGATYSSIFSVAYDPYAQLIMSGGSDLPITLWSPDGRVQHQIPMPNNFFVSNIHLEPNNRLLIACGAPNEPDPTGAIKGRVALYDCNGYTNVGNVARDDIISLAGVTTIRDTPHMLVAELLNTHGPGGNLVGLYDYHRVIASGLARADHQPLQRFIGHSDVVTAVAAGEGIFKDCFLSASKDKNVMVWDTRSQSPRPVATLGVRAGELRTTHTNMVTCVDVCGFNVMSASLDGTVALWDLRNSDEHNTITAVGVAGNDSPCLRKGQYTKWQAEGVVKAAMAGAPYEKLVAAATVKGLYLLDMSLPQPVVKLVEMPHMDPQQNYCEVKWCSGTKRFLTATGMTPNLELLECS